MQSEEDSKKAARVDMLKTMLMQHEEHGGPGSPMTSSQAQAGQQIMYRSAESEQQYRSQQQISMHPTMQNPANPMIALSNMTGSMEGMDRPAQNPMHQMASGMTGPRMQNLTPQQQMMIMRYQQQQQMRQQSGGSGSQSMPYPGPRMMGRLKQEPGSHNPRVASPHIDMSPTPPRGPTPPSRTPSAHGSEGSQSPSEIPNVRAGMKIKKENIHGMRPQGVQGQYGGQQHHMQAGYPGVQQRFAIGQQDIAQMGQMPRVRQPVDQMPGQGRGQMMLGRNQPSQMPMMNMRPMPPKPQTHSSVSQPTSSFMQMLNDDSDLMSLMSPHSQYTGVTGGFTQTTVYSQASMSNTPSSSQSLDENVSFMQLLTDTSTPPPDSADPNQAYIAAQQQSFQPQMRAPVPTPPMSDPMSGSPHEYSITVQSRSNMMPGSSQSQTTMGPTRMPYMTGQMASADPRAPPPYPGSANYPQQRMARPLNKNSLYQPPTSQYSQPSPGYPGQQRMPQYSHAPQTHMSMQAASRFPTQGSQSYPRRMMHPQMGGQRHPPITSDPWSPSTIPPNRDISVCTPQESRQNEYIEMDNMHEEIVEPIVIAPIDERIATKMDRSPRQDMMSLQNMINRLDNNQGPAYVPPPNYPIPTLNSPPGNDPRWYQMLSDNENRSPEVQLVSAYGGHGDSNRMPSDNPPPPPLLGQDGLSLRTCKLLKSMKKAQIVLKKLNMNGKTTVRLGLKKRAEKREKERIRKQRWREKQREKSYRSKNWKHVDRAHVYERRKKKHQSIAVSSESSLSDSDDQRRRKKRHAYRKRKSLSSESYMSESDYEDRRFRSKKRRTRAKKPQYYLGSDDEFEYEASLHGYSALYTTTPIDLSSLSSRHWKNSSAKKSKGESDVEFNPEDLGSFEDEEENSEESSSDSDTDSETDSETDDSKREREPRTPKKKQSSLRVMERFRSSSSEYDFAEPLLMDSDDEEYTPMQTKKRSQSCSEKRKRKRIMSPSSQSDESPRAKKKTRRETGSKKKRPRILSTSDATDDAEKPKQTKKKTAKAKSRGKKVAAKGECGEGEEEPAKKKTAKLATRNTRQKSKEATNTDVPVRTTRSRRYISTEESKADVETITTRRTRSQIRKDGLDNANQESSKAEQRYAVAKDTDKASNVVSTSEEVSNFVEAQDKNKTVDAQTEVSSTTESTVKQSSGFIPELDASPKEVSSTSESRKGGDKEKVLPCSSHENSNASTAVDTTNEQTLTAEDDKAGLPEPQSTSASAKNTNRKDVRELPIVEDSGSTDIDKTMTDNHSDGALLPPVLPKGTQTAMLNNDNLTKTGDITVQTSQTALECSDKTNINLVTNAEETESASQMESNIKQAELTSQVPKYAEQADLSPMQTEPGKLTESRLKETEHDKQTESNFEHTKLLQGQTGVLKQAISDTESVVQTMSPEKMMESDSGETDADRKTVELMEADAQPTQPGPPHNMLMPLQSEVTEKADLDGKPTEAYSELTKASAKAMESTEQAKSFPIKTESSVAKAESVQQAETGEETESTPTQYESASMIESVSNQMEAAEKTEAVSEKMVESEETDTISMLKHSTPTEIETLKKTESVTKHSKFKDQTELLPQKTELEQKLTHTVPAQNDFAEQTASNDEQTESKIEQTQSHDEKTESQAEQTAVHPEQTKSHPEQAESCAKQTESHAEQTELEPMEAEAVKQTSTLDQTKSILKQSDSDKQSEATSMQTNCTCEAEANADQTASVSQQSEAYIAQTESLSHQNEFNEPLEPKVAHTEPEDERNSKSLSQIRESDEQCETMLKLTERLEPGLNPPESNLDLPEPTPVQMEPTSVQTKPTSESVKPEPTSVQTELTPVQTELTSVQTELIPVQDEPISESIQTELNYVQSELFSIQTEPISVKAEQTAQPTVQTAPPAAVQTAQNEPSSAQTEPPLVQTEPPSVQTEQPLLHVEPDQTETILEPRPKDNMLEEPGSSVSPRASDTLKSETNIAADQNSVTSQEMTLSDSSAQGLESEPKADQGEVYCKQKEASGDQSAPLKLGPAAVHNSHGEPSDPVSRCGMSEVCQVIDTVPTSVTGEQVKPVSVSETVPHECIHKDTVTDTVIEKSEGEKSDSTSGVSDISDPSKASTAESPSENSDREPVPSETSEETSIL